MDVVEVHVTTGAAAEQLNPPPEPAEKVSPEGRVSDTVTVPDVGPPVLVTVRV
jgi:hypothetical protein